MTDSKGAHFPEKFTLSVEALTSLFGFVQEAVVCCRADGVITFVSPAIRAVLGYDPQSAVGRNILDFVHPDDIDWMLEGLARWEDRNGAPGGEEVRVRAADDGAWLSVRYDTVMTDLLGSLGTLVITLSDVTHVDDDTRLRQFRLMNEDRLVRLASAFLQVSVDDFEKGLDNAVRELAGLAWVTRVSVWTVDPMRPERINRRAVWSALRGAPSIPLEPRINANNLRLAQLVLRGKEVHLSAPWDNAQDFPQERAIAQMAGTTSLLAVPMISDGYVTGAVMLESTLGDVAYAATHSTTVRSAAAILAGAFERHEAEQNLAIQARTDRVTGLGNRWAFDEALDRALIQVSAGQSVGFGLGLIDLDRFKLVNDVLGHSAGDRLLADLAQRLLAAADPDTMVARLGGDEMLVLLDNSPSAAESHQRVQALVAALEPPFHLGGEALVITASVGLVHADDASIDAEELRRRADVAMYRAKGRGGDAIEVDDPNRPDHGDQMLRLESELRSAIRAGDLDVYYQGEFSLASGRPVGAEALVRWHHPEHGLLNAAQFVPLAEERGLVAQLGDIVLRKACAAAAPWRALDDEFVLRVNLAADQLRNVDLPDQILDALGEAGLPPEALCLELTESTLLADPVGSQAILEQIRAHGVGLAIDDFGTGYSSILQLKLMPLTSLKIDRSFVSGLPGSEVDRAIVASTIGLADTLGLAVTAEGVETEAQRRMLIDFGCCSAQGFLLGRPEPEDQFAGRLGL
ncbi:MAG: bifunctional diguanylate cyclase/phosphodiesterase [Aquihabitans sp.]